MSFFSKILKGLGFEEDEERPSKPTNQQKEKKKKEKYKSSYASFDLKQENNIVKDEPKIENNLEEVEKQVVTQKSSTLDIIKVTNQVEVQNVINIIKKGEQVIINMVSLSESDFTRSLDFLTGAVFALDKSIQKVDDAIFIIQ